MQWAGKYLHNGLVTSERSEIDRVFKALADPTRRLLLDQLRKRNGQSLSDLCELLDMARQSVTQHLNLLEAANLVSVARRGRERLHYLNPAPIHEIERRWISAFDAPRLDQLAHIKATAETKFATERQTMTTEPESVPNFVYVTYIQATAQTVWQALTDAELTAKYWAHANVSDWKPGSTWEQRRLDGTEQADIVGRVLESEPPKRLSFTFESPDADPVETPSVVTFVIEPHQDIVRLTVTHEHLADAQGLSEISHGWPAVLANLKSMIETGDVLPAAPWEMPMVTT